MILSTTAEKVETCEADLAKMIANFWQTLTDAGIDTGGAHDLTMVFAKEVCPVWAQGYANPPRLSFPGYPYPDPDFLAKNKPD